jgi:hypothetical protein
MIGPGGWAPKSSPPHSRPDRQTPLRARVFAMSHARAAHLVRAAVGETERLRRRDNLKRSSTLAAQRGQGVPLAAPGSAVRGRGSDDCWAEHLRNSLSPGAGSLCKPQAQPFRVSGPELPAECSTVQAPFCGLVPFDSLEKPCHSLGLLPAPPGAALNFPRIQAGRTCRQPPLLTTRRGRP